MSEVFGATLAVRSSTISRNTANNKNAAYGGGGVLFQLTDISSVLGKYTISDSEISYNKVTAGGTQGGGGVLILAGNQAANNFTFTNTNIIGAGSPHIMSS